MQLGLYISRLHLIISLLTTSIPSYHLYLPITQKPAISPANPAPNPAIPVSQPPRGYSPPFEFGEIPRLVNIIPPLVADSLEIRNAVGYLQISSLVYAQYYSKFRSPLKIPVER